MASNQTRTIAEANRDRHRARRAMLADRLRPLGELSSREAARLLGISPSVVRGLRNEFGLPRPSPGQMRRVGEANRLAAEARHAELAALLERLGALTAAEAATVLGVSTRIVKRVRAERPWLPSPRRRTDREES